MEDRADLRDLLEEPGTRPGAVPSPRHGWWRRAVLLLWSAYFKWYLGAPSRRHDFAFHLMRVGELEPGQVIVHPTTGQHVTVKEVKQMSRMLRVYFYTHGVTGWFMVGSHDQEVQVPIKPKK